MARHLDLDQLRAARAEASGEQPTVVLFGTTYTLPAAMPLAVIEAAALEDAASFRAAVISLIGEHGMQACLAQGASRDDLEELVVLASEKLYGAADPEDSGASSPSSATTSTRSKPTSAATTT